MSKVTYLYIFILTVFVSGSKHILDDLENEQTLQLPRVEQFFQNEDHHNHNIRERKTYDETNEREEAPYFTNIKKMPKFIVKPSGNILILKCKSEGYPTPNITWYKNSQAIAKELRDVQYRRWTLALEDLTISDSGTYTCVVCNTLGCIDYNFTVDVIERIHHRPILIKYPQNATVVVGSNISFNCTFISDLHPYSYWIKGLSEDYEAHKIKLNESDATTTVLELHNITHEFEGWYTCIVANTLGTTTASAHLEVIDITLEENTVSTNDTKQLYNV